MAKDSIEIICRACDCAVEAVEDPEGDDIVTCPSCGASDPFAVVMEKVSDELSEVVGDSLIGELADGLGNSSSVKVTPKPDRQSGYKFTFRRDPSHSKYLR